MTLTLDDKIAVMEEHARKTRTRVPRSIEVSQGLVFKGQKFWFTDQNLILYVFMRFEVVLGSEVVSNERNASLTTMSVTATESWAFREIANRSSTSSVCRFQSRGRLCLTSQANEFRISANLLLSPSDATSCVISTTNQAWLTRPGKNGEMPN